MTEYSITPADGVLTQANAAEDTASGEENAALLVKILRDFQDSFWASMDERERGQLCRNYYDGFQWTEDEIQALRKRKQPIITANRIAPKVNALIGFEKRQRTDPKAYPRTPRHEKDAESATDALRYVAQQQAFDKKRSNAAESLAIEGIGAVCVGAKPKANGEYEITLNLVHWDRFYRDMHSRERDFSDATFMGEVIWMYEDQANAEFKGKEDVITGSYSSGGDVFASTFDDRPKVIWADTGKKRIRVMKHRWKDPEKGWMIAVLCRGGFLWGPHPSPYLDEEGQPSNDLIAVSAFVTTENERYGPVWNWLTIQDEINKRRSKALHRLGVNQIVAEKGAVANKSQAQQEAAKPDGYVEYNPEFKFEIRDGLAPMQGEMALLAESKAELDTIATNPSLQGDRRAPSGRAQEIQQVSALSEFSIFFDALRDWSWRVYRASWCRIRQYWDGPMWVRVTDDEQNLKWVGLNQPVTAAQMAQQLMQQGQPVPPDLALLATAAPQTVVETQNPVASLDVDIIVEDGPDVVTIQAEQFAALVELKKADPMAIPTDMVIEASNLRNKDRILEHLKAGGLPPQVAQQMQALQQQLQEATAKLAKAEQNGTTEAMKAQTAQIEALTAQFEAMTKRFEAITDREKAQTERIEAMTPQVGVVVEGTPSRFQ